VKPARVYVTPLAPTLPVTDVDIFEVLARHRIEQPYILSVGTLEPRKNLTRLVRAYRRLSARGAPGRFWRISPGGNSRPTATRSSPRPSGRSRIVFPSTGH